MWLEDDEIDSHWRSGKPDLIEAALGAIEERYAIGDEIAMPTVDAAVLAVFADGLPAPAMRRLLDYVCETLTAAQAQQLGLLVAHTATSTNAFEIAQKVKISTAPAELANEALGAIAGLEAGTVQVDTVAYFASCLADLPALREPVITWAQSLHADWQPVRKEVAAELGIKLAAAPEAPQLQSLNPDTSTSKAIVAALADGRMTLLRVTAWDLFDSFSGQHELVESSIRHRSGAFHLAGKVLETDPGIRAEVFERVLTQDQLVAFLDRARGAEGVEFLVRMAG